MAEEKNECIFCKIANGEIPTNKIYENDNFFSIYDISPALEGHALIVSKKHFSNILELPDTSGQEFLDAVKKTSMILTKEFKAEGFNVIGNVNEVSGQIIHHFHVHLIPRKESDNARLKYIDKDTGESAELKDKKV